MNVLKKVSKERNNILFNISFVLLTLVAVVLFYKNIMLTTFIVGIIAIIGLIKWRSVLTLVLFILGGLGGTMSEIFAIYYGAWNYSFANFFDIPIWLFIVWGNTVAFLYQTGKEFRKFGLK